MPISYSMNTLYYTLYHTSVAFDDIDIIIILPRIYIKSVNELFPFHF